LWVVLVTMSACGTVTTGRLLGQHTLTHYTRMHGYAQRLRHAEKLLDVYARAKMVVTSRLHCALPARAMGALVSFQPDNWIDRRYTGLDKYLRCEEDQQLERAVAEMCDRVREFVAA